MNYFFSGIFRFHPLSFLPGSFFLGLGKAKESATTSDQTRKKISKDFIFHPNRSVMKSKIPFLSAILLLAMVSILNGQSDIQLSGIDIPYEKVILDNGLTVIIHEDHKAPVVAVNVWYHVGSKNEKPGRTGFAHLFEHLMFNGSEHFDDDYFKALDKIGATDLNGTTNNDRTNYFETVPVSAFDRVLWLESDRMGFMVNAITQEKLDEQRGVVQNEKRQYENEPFGNVDEYMSKAVYPNDHPYSWTVIGSMEDLTGASLDDVKEWFKTYYTPNNAVLVIAGDVQTDEALEKVKKYFGAIPAGPPIVKMKAWTSKRTGTIKQVMQDRVNQERLYKVWNVPADGTHEANMLDIVSQVLSSGKNSRLYKRLVYDEQLVSSIYSYVAGNEIASLFTIRTDLKPGADADKVNSMIDEEIRKVIMEGPTEEELSKIKTTSFASMVRGMERVGGFGGKSDILARSEVYFGNPDQYKSYLEDILAAKPESVQQAAKRWLSDGEYILTVKPFPEFVAAPVDADRTRIPDLEEAPAINFPEFERTTLSNGLKVVLAHRSTVPVVTLRMNFRAGFASDALSTPGMAKLAMDMLDEGTEKMTSLEISSALEQLGTTLGTGSGLDQSIVALNSLKANLDPSLKIFADVILHPLFPQKELDRLRKDQLIAIQREKMQPTGMALRILPRFLYGENHPYGMPLTGSGFEETVEKITREEIVQYYKKWLRPNNATLIVVGDIGLSELTPMLEKYFSGWKKAEIPDLKLSKVQAPSKPVIYLMDRPGSIQSLIIGGNLVAPLGEYNEAALEIMNSIIGGEFTSRINMNLREDKHWSYGASTFIMDARAQRPFLAYTSVQSDKTMESILEIGNELSGFIGADAATEEEIDKNKENQILQIPGNYETMSDITGDISTIVTYNLSDDYFEKYTENLKQLDTQDVRKVAEKVINPDHMVWVVVGDRDSIEESLKSLGIEIRNIDSDGNVIPGKDR